MKTLRKLSSVIVLTLMIGVPSFAGQTEATPCAAPVPGQTESQPCQGTAPSVTGDPSNSSTAMAAGEMLTEIAIELLESMIF